MSWTGREHSYTRRVKSIFAKYDLTPDPALVSELVAEMQTINDDGQRAGWDDATDDDYNVGFKF